MHPAYILDEEDYLLVELWARCRGAEVNGMIGGMAAGMIASGPIAGRLPESGGLLDQANCTLESLAILEAAYQVLKPKPTDKESND